MRVLLTTPYDLAVPGGVNRHVCDLLEELTNRGVDARLVGPTSGPVEGEDPRVVRIGRVSVHRMNGARSRVTLELGIGAAVRRLVRAFAPDVVHLQEPFLPTLNTFVLAAAGAARRVGTFHTYSEASRGYLWAWPWCRWVNARLDARIAVSPAARDFATHYHPAPFQVVPNGIRAERVHARRPAGPPGRPVRLLFVGRAGEPRKGFAVLRAALARLEREAPGSFTLVVAGPDEVRPDGLPLAWLGELDDRALSAAYVAADVAVVPSTGGESFGLVALEALAHGVPVVASRIRGYAEWLDGAGAGGLAAPGDPAALADALRAAVEPARHAHQAARAVEVAARWDWSVLAGRVLEVYRGGGPGEGSVL